jgi:endonuclease-8
MALRTESGAAAYQFGGPILRLLSAGELRRDRRLRQLGPDILGSDFTAATGVRALRAAAADRAIGDALLDQHLIAGIGNIYKSEALWDAGVVPQRPIGELSGERLESVVDAAMSLMREAVITGRQPKRIYRRVGMPCPRCGETIRSGGQGDANRMSYWCPRCQR